MKLLNLQISSEYGSIKEDFHLQFRDVVDDAIGERTDLNEFHPFCFAGLNGSGKSNVLEALANIFYHIECCANVNQPENFKEVFNPHTCKPDAFDLEYLIGKEEDYKLDDLIKVRISKEKDNLPEMYYQNYPFEKEPIEVPILGDKKTKIQSSAKSYLPDLVIGYSSGENEILSIPFLKTRLLHFDEYKTALIDNTKYSVPESSLLYIDYEMSQAVLLANLIFQGKEVLKPIREEIGISDIVRFRMNINSHQDKSSNLYLIDQYNKIIDNFKKCATSIFEIEDEKLLLDFYINDATIAAFKKNFPDGIFQLFQAFQILYTLNYHDIDEEIKTEIYESKGYYTDGKVPKPKPAETVFHFLDYYIKKQHPGSDEEIHLLMKNLSDGEQQFLHTMGICLMLEGKSALLLLDEPETHFNPDWRSKFIRTLKKSLEQSKSNNLMQDILITSHSPFIISDCYPDKVIVFKNGDSPVNAIDLDIPTFGTSVNILTHKIFGSRKSISQFSYEKLSEYRQRFDEGESFESIQAEVNEKFGDSIEKLLLLKELNENSKK
ncbi:restriction system-associated AAA family ATPase [Ancylomarina sp. DW003]|nr:restriction system-associated AAA family ATPase [Ancylomarina sp. DW003]MDE5423674.1 restriction system-associated AAA family ATPase [Ancylomarina sp. DW003]